MNSISVSTRHSCSGAPGSAQQERFIRLPEVMHLCGLSRSTIYDLISRDAFPQQISLGGKNVAWVQSEVSAWMAARIAAPRARRPMRETCFAVSSPFLLACVLISFPGIVFPLPQNRLPGVGTRVTYWRHQTRRASFLRRCSGTPIFRAAVLIP